MMQKPDKFIALIGIGGSIIIFSILLVLEIFQPIPLIATLFFTFLYHYIREKSIAKLYLEDLGNHHTFLNRIPNIHVWLTVTTLILDLLIIHSSENVLYRPLWIFIGLSLHAVIIFMQVEQKIYRINGGEFAILVQIVSLHITITASSIIAYPFNGSDTWAHLKNAELVAQFQSISGVSGSYRNYPLFPALISTISTMMNSSINQAARLVVIISSAACLILLFAFTRNYYGTYKGLLVALLFLGSKWITYWNTLVVSMSMALLFFTLFFILLSTRLFNGKQKQSTILYLYIAAILAPFFHPVAPVAIIILSISYWLTDRIFFKDKIIPTGNIIILITFVVVATLSQWIYYGTTFERAMQSLFSAIFQDSGNFRDFGVSNSAPLIYTLDNINFYILLILGILETLRQIRIRKDRLILYSGIAGIVFVAFAYFTQFINLQEVLPYRWLLFGSVALFYPASNIFVSLLRLKHTVQKILLFSGFTAIIFLSYANKEVNRDHPLYGVQTAERYEISFPEYAGLQFILENKEILQSRITMDVRLWDFLKLEFRDPNLAYWKEIKLSDQNTVFSLRKVYYDHWTAFVGDSILRITPNTPNLNQFYDSGDLQWMDWVPNTRPIQK